MKITIVSGSHRNNSQSLKVAKFLKTRLLSLELCKEVSIIDLAEKNIPFWDEGVWKNEKKWVKVWNPIEKILRDSAGFVFVSPDWAGMVPAKLKNFFLLCNPNTLGHKPALIVSVSAGSGGAYPVSELRASSYKNTKICYLPEHVIIRNCEQVLNNSEEPVVGECDKYIQKRIDFTLEILNQYCNAFKSIKINHEVYPYGM